ncbi:D-arabinono-1,4-lactone oxidase [Marininema halotolerans]|uniref:FAD-linked oxidoreductase n=1 Tax=Marininema halotolerans TaxID=1155944 RepID=A0A1I6R441_9BACL|nr:D-arabinono-1,4-lactone oxidase [Marininema halotolerans]SFS59475.1 FAD-linked oxidoreductase [Marininema halotolerans]
MSEAGPSKVFMNWSGSVQCHPAEIVRPSSIEEVVDLVRRAAFAGRTLRAVGSGHSFTPLVETDEILVSLEELQGLVKVDPVRQVATVRGGTPLSALGVALEEAGWAMENLGDIDAQTIAGAISTGTHGTGVTLGSISSQVVGITFVTANGEVVTHTQEEHSETLRGSRISLGSLGIIVEVQLRVLPRYFLQLESRRMELTEVLNSLPSLKSEHRHFEFFWFPYTETVQAKIMNMTDTPGKEGGWWGEFSRNVLENGLFWCLSEGARLQPRFSANVSRISAWGVPSVKETGVSRRIFATPRKVRFYEMEYAIPAETLPEVLKEVKARIAQEGFAVHFPVECRFTRKEENWLSPAYGRDSAFVAVHMYRGMEWRPYFKAMEEIFLRYEGRPHWGKMHGLDAMTFAEIYPQWDEFHTLRAGMDPQGIFLNPYLKKILDPTRISTKV